MVREVKMVVFEILHPNGTDGENGDNPGARQQHRIKLAGQLKDAVKERKSWEEVEKLVEELEKLLKLAK